MHGPCAGNLACIRGTCQRYDRKAYLKGEYAYDNGDCGTEGNKYCLLKNDACINYNKKYVIWDGGRKWNYHTSLTH